MAMAELPAMEQGQVHKKPEDVFFGVLWESSQDPCLFSVSFSNGQINVGRSFSVIWSAVGVVCPA
jgi:hypothetical protein